MLELVQTRFRGKCQFQVLSLARGNREFLVGRWEDREEVLGEFLGLFCSVESDVDGLLGVVDECDDARALAVNADNSKVDILVLRLIQFKFEGCALALDSDVDLV